MARIDSLDILSDHQTLDGNSYSTFFKPIGSSCDWGATGIPKYIHVVAHGTCSLGTSLEIQVIGANDIEAMSDAFVIATTGPTQNSEINEGWNKLLAIGAVGKKYAYIGVNYVFAGGGDSHADHKEETLCPTSPVLDKSKPTPNTFSAYIDLSADTGLTYPYVNQDKITA